MRAHIVSDVYCVQIWHNNPSAEGKVLGESTTSPIQMEYGPIGPTFLDPCMLAQFEYTGCAKK